MALILVFGLSLLEPVPNEFRPALLEVLESPPGYGVSCVFNRALLGLIGAFWLAAESTADWVVWLIFGFFGGAETETETTPVLFTAGILFLSNRGLYGFKIGLHGLLVYIE